MGKVFFVPPADEIGSGAWHMEIPPLCPIGHLARFLGAKEERYKAVEDLVGSYPPIPELYRSNNAATDGKARRKNFIKWLRKYFPDGEVK